MPTIRYVAVEVMSTVWQPCCIDGVHPHEQDGASLQPKESPMFHLAISCSSYILFFLAKMLTPMQQSAWRAQEQTRTIRTIL